MALARLGRKNHAPLAPLDVFLAPAESVLGLLADGSVRFLDYSAAPIMPALATRAGSEFVTLPD